MSETHWVGENPPKCDLCGAPIIDQFVDGRIKGRTQWGIMCPSCHENRGIGLGTGLGQLYQRKGNYFNKVKG